MPTSKEAMRISKHTVPTMQDDFRALMESNNNPSRYTEPYQRIVSKFMHLENRYNTLAIRYECLRYQNERLTLSLNPYRNQIPLPVRDARAEALAIVEILENILVDTDDHRAILAAQAVNRHWRAVTNGSLMLQRALFKHPSLSFLRQAVFRNPFLFTSTGQVKPLILSIDSANTIKLGIGKPNRPFYQMESYAGYTVRQNYDFELRITIHLHRFSSKSGSAISFVQIPGYTTSELRDSGSWKESYLTQPPMPLRFLARPQTQQDAHSYAAGTSTIKLLGRPEGWGGNPEMLLCGPGPGSASSSAHGPASGGVDREEAPPLNIADLLQAKWFAGLISEQRKKLQQEEDWETMEMQRQLAMAEASKRFAAGGRVLEGAGDESVMGRWGSDYVMSTGLDGAGDEGDWEFDDVE